MSVKGPLLSHDQMGDAIDEALKRCVADKELSPAHEIAAEVCRAQLREVAEWAEARNANQTTRGHVTLLWSDMQALRAAGGAQ